MATVINTDEAAAAASTKNADHSRGSRSVRLSRSGGLRCRSRANLRGCVAVVNRRSPRRLLLRFAIEDFLDRQAELRVSSERRPRLKLGEPRQPHLIFGGLQRNVFHALGHLYAV